MLIFYKLKQGTDDANGSKIRRFPLHIYPFVQWFYISSGFACSCSGIVGGIAVNMASMILKWLLPLSTPMTKAGNFWALGILTSIPLLLFLSDGLCSISVWF
ncbi:hypothetical protein Droror1_Dr00023890 [Drosera rotundifolia]